MYLKSIKAHGFKSFADAINLEIKSGITGIVGPNGSGKSNIVDAVKWVLGEQSVKALRGTNAMSDVIFAGSKSRNKMTRAYVSLTFDNSDNYLNSNYDNVEIKRVLYQNGDNDYFLNNVKVRLKDITDLFIDSGAGKESFNIISQGSVGDIINSKPEERRIIFESAAGVLKYKKRKEETTRKLLKVNDNLEKIELIIRELEENLKPLEAQADIAQKYLLDQSKLKDLEIALIAKDINDVSSEYNILKEKIKKLEEQILQDDVTANDDYAKLEKLKLENIALDENINIINNKLLNITKELSVLNSQKQVTIERKKYEVDSKLLDNNILFLKEAELTINKNIETVSKEIEILQDNLEKEEEKYQEQIKKYQMQSLEKVNCNTTLEALAKEKLSVVNNIEILQDNLENDNKLPYSVKSILSNPRLKGIHDTIGKVLKINSEYVLAIDTLLGYSANILIVDNENSAKDAINYLKDNKLGRATFFPLNIIKPKNIEATILDEVKKIKGFIGVASNLVNYEKLYDKIIKNQLGNVLVVDNIATLTKVGKLINYKYRVVSLDGEILHTGGAYSGGTVKNTASSVIMQKDKLNELKQKLSTLDKEIEDVSKNLNDSIKKVDQEESKLNEINVLINDIKEAINRKKLTLHDLKLEYEEKHNELEGTKNVKENRLDDELNKLLEEYYKTSGKKDILEKELVKLKDNKNELILQINDIEKANKEKTAIYNKKAQELKECEIKVGKYDVKLDNLLNILNETYNITYEKARDNFKLSIQINDAREEVAKLKKQMRSYGEVNIGAIKEYERINTRYTFKKKKKGDLEQSILSLENAISQMDEIMITRFTETFSAIEKEFNEVYKKLFKGGHGCLKLTSPDNLLETGIEIIAEPPGKKLNSIGLLSGGEKTLTAISLLFAILNVKPVPFVILDEVEAALDEANVEAFGKYLIEKKDKSQFIIITHKKKTMEYADILYGITMQESGVSKLVSVKLENI